MHFKGRISLPFIQDIWRYWKKNVPKCHLLKPSPQQNPKPYKKQIVYCLLFRVEICEYLHFRMCGLVYHTSWENDKQDWWVRKYGKITKWWICKVMNVHTWWIFKCEYAIINTKNDEYANMNNMQNWTLTNDKSANSMK